MLGWFEGQNSLTVRYALSFSLWVLYSSDDTRSAEWKYKTEVWVKLVTLKHILCREGCFSSKCFLSERTRVARAQMAALTVA